MVFLGQERQGGRFAQDAPGTEFVRSRGDELPVVGENVWGIGLPMDDQSAVEFRTHGMRLERERGHDAKVASTTAQRPEQV